MKKQPNIRLLHWAPRILCILAILFISLFALDAFKPGLSLGQQFADFGMHMLPSCILLALLLIAAKWELPGGILFIVLSLVLSPFIYVHNYYINHSVFISLEIIMLITFPFFAVGVLFILSHFAKRKKPLAEP